MFIILVLYIEVSNVIKENESKGQQLTSLLNHHKHVYIYKISNVNGLIKFKIDSSYLHEDFLLKAPLRSSRLGANVWARGH